MVAAAETDSDATVVAIADRLKLAANTVTELAARVEQRGLISRDDLPGDRRAVRLRLTDDGRRRVDAAVHALRNERRQLADSLANLTR